jgi:hypothetical protein
MCRLNLGSLSLSQLKHQRVWRAWLGWPYASKQRIGPIVCCSEVEVSKNIGVFGGWVEKWFHNKTGTAFILRQLPWVWRAFGLCSVVVVAVYQYRLLIYVILLYKRGRHRSGIWAANFTRGDARDLRGSHCKSNTVNPAYDGIGKDQILFRCRQIHGT